MASSGIDEIFGMPTKWALGYSVGRPGAMDATSVFGIGGVGGGFAYGDTSTGISFALTKNRLTQDFNAATQLSQLVTDTLVR
jgi:hypothetical protein